VQKIIFLRRRVVVAVENVDKKCLSLSKKNQKISCKHFASVDQNEKVKVMELKTTKYLTSMSKFLNILKYFSYLVFEEKLFSFGH
jgi:hypothetical protein